MAATAAAAAVTAAFIPRHPILPATAPIPTRSTRKRNPNPNPNPNLVCHVAVATGDASAASLSEEELAMAGKVGRKARVKVPLRVYHVGKAPDLDLNGREGTIKQYVGVWKGKRISANLPFKVEFFVPVDGQPAPVRVLAHLKEDEFDYLLEKIDNLK